MRSDADATTPVQAPAGEGQPCDREQLSLRIPPLIEQAWVGFRRDLPELLRERPGQWVAYHGDKPIGFDKTKTKLYQECLRRGIDEDELLVLYIEPEVEGIVMGPRAVD